MHGPFRMHQLGIYVFRIGWNPPQVQRRTSVVSLSVQLGPESEKKARVYLQELGSRPPGNKLDFDQSNGGEFFYPHSTDSTLHALKREAHS